MSSTTTGAFCAQCGRRREPRELVLVTPLDGRTPYCLCRASVSGECFRTVGSASRERIEQLAEYLAREQSA